MKGILLDENYDLRIENGGFVIGETLNQEVSIILQLNQGQLRHDPLLGPNLIQLINSNTSQTEIQTRVKLHLERDKKDFERYKERIRLL